MIDLSGNVALVTGGSRGIGRAIAIRLAEAGADVALNYVSSRSAAMETAEAIQALGRKVAVIKADISEQDDIEAMVEFVAERFGRLDILVSNAASGGFRPLLSTTAQQFEAAMNTNARALVFLARAALPLLRKTERRSKIIALSSHGAELALPMYGLIGASKAALESLARHLALELGNQSVNVNVVRAGLVETDSTRNLPGVDTLFEADRSRSLCGGRKLQPRDVADAVLYLASPLSDMIQGQTIVIDGGASIHV